MSPPDVSEQPSAVAKRLLLRAMRERGVRPVELSRRLGTLQQCVTRLVNTGHVTKIDTIARALETLGYRLVLTAVPIEGQGAPAAAETTA